MKILVAEDDPVSRRLLRHHLEKWGHEVTAAADGAEAWDLFGKGQFDLVISDWVMPHVEGPDLIRRIRGSQRPHYVYAILLTARSQVQDVVVGMEAGADDFLTKPFDREELRVRVRAGERIIELEHSLAQRNEQLTAANAELGAAHERMKDELEAAARVQRALLPREVPVSPRARFEWRFTPCEEVAGDILNVFRLDDRHIAMYVLDVSGHGVASALLSVTVSRFLALGPDATSLLQEPNEGTCPIALSPARVADRLNSLFPFDVATGQYFTLLYGVLDLETRGFRFVSAGHPGAIHLASDQPPVVANVTGYPIGMADAPYEEQAIQLGLGDRLYLYSDGVTEAMSPVEEPFGEDRMLGLLGGARGLSLAESIGILAGGVEDWRGQAHLDDDLTVLAVELT